MSIATEISRIQTDKNIIRDKLVELGLATSEDNLDKLAAAIESLVNRGAVSKTLDVTAVTYTIPEGYHNGEGTVQITLESKSVTPNKTTQTVVPSTGKLLGNVTVNPIPEAYHDVTSVTATKDDVLTGKIFVDKDGNVITGEMVNNGAVSQTLDVTTISYTIPKGFHNGSGKVQLVLETKTVTPSNTEQTIKPTSGKVLSEVTVNPIPDNYGAVDNADATAANILNGKIALVKDSNGKAVEVEGAMPNNGAIAKPMDGLTNNIVAIPEGYTSGGTVYLTNDIEEALAAT